MIAKLLMSKWVLSALMKNKVLLGLGTADLALKNDGTDTAISHKA